jgi:hypothetical protein
MLLLSSHSKSERPQTSRASKMSSGYSSAGGDESVDVDHNGRDDKLNVTINLPRMSRDSASLLRLIKSMCKASHPLLARSGVRSVYLQQCGIDSDNAAIYADDAADANSASEEFKTNTGGTSRSYPGTYSNVRSSGSSSIVGDDRDLVQAFHMRICADACHLPGHAVPPFLTPFSANFQMCYQQQRRLERKHQHQHSMATYSNVDEDAKMEDEAFALPAQVLKAFNDPEVFPEKAGFDTFRRASMIPQTSRTKKLHDISNDKAWVNSKVEEKENEEGRGEECSRGTFDKEEEEAKREVENENRKADQLHRSEKLIRVVRLLYQEKMMTSGIAQFWEGALGHVRYLDVTKKGMNKVSTTRVLPTSFKFFKYEQISCKRA